MISQRNDRIMREVALGLNQSEVARIHGMSASRVHQVIFSTSRRPFVSKEGGYVWLPSYDDKHRWIRSMRVRAEMYVEARYGWTPPTSRRG